MIRVYWPAGRKYAEMLIDAAHKRVVTALGATVTLPVTPLPDIDLLSNTVAELAWAESPILQKDGVDVPIGPAIRVRESEAAGALFKSLRHETVPVRPGIGLVFHGNIVPIVELMADGVRLRWKDRVRADVPGVPSMIEPTVDHIDVRRKQAVIVLSGFGDVTVDFE